MKLIYIMMALATAVVGQLRKGPHKKSRTSRTGDNDVAMFRYGIMAAVYSNGEIKCAGALYRKDIVISESVHIQVPHSFLSVKVFPKTPKEGRLVEETYNVKGIKHHPDYSIHKSPKNNIAVIKLDRPENEFTGLKLDTSGLGDKVGEKLTLLGWATDRDDWGSSSSFKSLEVEIHSNETCLKEHSYPYSEAQEFCAGDLADNFYPYFMSAGSPLVKINPDHSITLVGINSWSENYDKEYQPNVFVKINAFEDFITKSIRSR